MYKIILQGNLHFFDWGESSVEFYFNGDGIYVQFDCQEEVLPDDAVERLKAASKANTPARLVVTILDDIDEDEPVRNDPR